MTERELLGVWRSCKRFYHDGRLEHHRASFFVELSVDRDGVLTMVHSETRRQVFVLELGEWKVEQIKKRQYLYFGKRQAYEIITLEPEDLVLADTVKGEKLFFAKLPGWHHRVESGITSTRHIHPGKETEDC